MSAPPERAARSRFPLQETIHLTEQEHELFAYLLTVKEHAGDCDVELRVCGGWVRDKLLSRESSDVDVALDTMTGRDFAALVNAYERERGQKERGVGVMRGAKPEQAKRLEVVTMHLGDMGKVDFAAMRASLASEDASGGEADAFGTPLQDAQRRDFTINSLFYNISTREVEDFTQQGICDLRDGVIRTPLDARMMLLDDPIRAVRAVRFAAQFDFRLEPSLRSALELDEVKHALATKISRRRLGQVLTETLVGASAHAGRALQLIRELRLLQPMLLPDVPELSTVELQDGTLASYASASHAETDDIWDRSCAYALQMCDLVTDAGGESDGGYALMIRVLGALMLPFAGHRVPTRDVSLPTYMVRDSLKLSNQEAKDVDLGVLRALNSVQALVHAEEFDRVRVGLVLRALRPHWGICRDVALARELVDSQALSPDHQDDQIRRRYDAFTASVVASGLDDIASQPLLFTGGELVAELNVTPGAAVKQLLDDVLVWQLKHPGESRSACLAHFRARSSSVT